jgi:hypothetical protein
MVGETEELRERRHSIAYHYWYHINRSQIDFMCLRVTRHAMVYKSLHEWDPIASWFPPRLVAHDAKANLESCRFCRLQYLYSAVVQFDANEVGSGRRGWSRDHTRHTDGGLGAGKLRLSGSRPSSPSYSLTCSMGCRYPRRNANQRCSCRVVSMGRLFNDAVLTVHDPW